MSDPQSLSTCNTVTPCVPALPSAAPPTAEQGGIRPLLGGILTGIGKGFDALVDIEQRLTRPLAALPYPSLPALRVKDMVLGMFHPHLPILPLPPFGPIVRFFPAPQFGWLTKLPLGISGAPTVRINGELAARCGDMAICLPTCLGFMPIAEMFMGSASVWIESQRAARFGDLSLHCTMLDHALSPAAGVGFLPHSPDVEIGGFPLPSLTDFAAAKILEGAFRGLRGATRGTTRATGAALAGGPHKFHPPNLDELILHHLRKDPKLIAKVYASPMMVKRLHDFISNGGRIGYNKGKGSYISLDGGPYIQLDLKQNTTQALAHELGHWHDKITLPDPAAHRGDRDKFVDYYAERLLESEGAALFAENDVYRELGELNPRYIDNQYGSYEAIINKYAGQGPPYPKEALVEMGNLLREYPFGIGGGTYLQEYEKYAEAAFDELFASSP